MYSFRLLSLSLSLLFILLVLPPGVASAATLFAVVSDNSAPDLASGVSRFQEQHPGHRLVFRSAAQLMEMGDAELQDQLHAADAVLLLGLFSDPAQRLATALEAMPGNLPVLAQHSDRRLDQLTRRRGQLLLAGLAADPQFRDRLQEQQRIEQGRELPDLPEGFGDAGAGFENVGTVYRDPRTGKLIMVGREGD